MRCQESEQLLDVYLAALGDYYDARKPRLSRWLRPVTDASIARLVEARHGYWSHIEDCGCASRKISAAAELTNVT
jgi:hypothetical protein